MVIGAEVLNSWQEFFRWAILLLFSWHFWPELLSRQFIRLGVRKLLPSC